MTPNGRSIAILYGMTEYLIKTAYWSYRKIETLNERTLGS